MNYYKLVNKQMDNDFLAGNVVYCPASVPQTQAEKGIVSAGLPIVIALSTGAKYKGKILRFDYSVVAGIAIGELQVVRA